MKNWADSGRVAAVHLVLSLGVALLAAWLVFGWWYPAPFDQLSGGRSLFTLLVSVDVVLGPLMTLVVFNRAKSRWHLVGDFSVIAFLQLAALGYGIWTVFEARPVYLAFEIDRIRVVHAVDVADELLSSTPLDFKTLPLWGPSLVAVRPFVSATEKTEATMAALGGVELGFRPDFWMRYEDARADVLRAAKPVSELIARKPAMRAALIQALESAGQSDDAVLLYLPLHGRSEFWTVLLDPANARPVAYLPLDPY
jgi:hypothetical protein